MRRIRKSMIWMGALLFCSGAVFAQKAERKNVREVISCTPTKNIPNRKYLIAKAWR